MITFNNILQRWDSTPTTWDLIENTRWFDPRSAKHYGGGSDSQGGTKGSQFTDFIYKTHRPLLIDNSNSGNTGEQYSKVDESGNYNNMLYIALKFKEGVTSDCQNKSCQAVCDATGERLGPL